MNLLLDTPVLLWWLSDSRRLSDEAQRHISDPAHSVWLSSAVLWEIKLKESLGKLTLPADFRTALETQGFEELPIAGAHAYRLGTLPGIHRDPFDRMLVAQALQEAMTIVTRDERIARYPVPILLA